MQDYGGLRGTSSQPYGGPGQQPPPPEQAPSAPPQPMPMAGGRSKVPMLVIVFAILIIIFMGISLALPWYTTHSKDSGEFFGVSYKSESTQNYGLFDVSWEYEETVSGVTESSSDSKSWGDLDEGYEHQKPVYTYTLILVIIGMIMAILLLIGGILAIKGKKRIIPIIFGLLALIFCLLAPIVFLAMHPGAWSDDIGGAEGDGPWSSFMGSEDDYNWGPGAGWVVAFLGFIFALIGFIISLKLPKMAASSPYLPPRPQPSQSFYDNPPLEPGYPPQQQQQPPRYPGY